MPVSGLICSCRYIPGGITSRLHAFYFVEVCQLFHLRKCATTYYAISEKIRNGTVLDENMCLNLQVITPLENIITESVVIHCMRLQCDITHMNTFDIIGALY